MAAKKRARGSDAVGGKKKPKTVKTPRARKVRDEDEVPSSERRRSGRAHKQANYAESDEENEDVDMEDAEAGAEAEDDSEPEEADEEDQEEEEPAGEKEATPPPPVTKASKLKSRTNGIAAPIAAPVSPKVAKAKALAKKASASPLGKRASGRGARGKKKKERDIMSIPSDSD